MWRDERKDGKGGSLDRWVGRLPFKGSHCHRNVSQLSYGDKWHPFFSLPSVATGNSNSDVLMIMMMMTIITAARKASHARLKTKLTPPLSLRCKDKYILVFRCQYFRCK